MLIKSLIVGLIATSVITIFSYRFSPWRDGKLNEPKLLNYLIILNVSGKITGMPSRVVGWIIHYFIGILLALIFDLLIDHGILKAEIWSGLLYGLVTGIIGVAGWTCLIISHRKLLLNFTVEFYNHIILAHILFGLMAVLIYQIFGW